MPVHKLLEVEGLVQPLIEGPQPTSNALEMYMLNPKLSVVLFIFTKHN